MSSEEDSPGVLLGIQCLLLPEFVLEMEAGDVDHPLVNRSPWEPPPPEWDG